MAAQTKGVLFNERRAFGTIHPTEPRKAADGTTVAVSFEQRGVDGITRMYGPAPDYLRVLVDGQTLEDIEEVRTTTKAKADAAKKAAADKAAKKSAAPDKPKATGRFAQLAGGDNTADKADGKPSDSASLAEWAAGDAEIPFADVRRRIKEDYDVDVSDENEAAEVLVANGVIEAGDVMVSAEPG